MSAGDLIAGAWLALVAGWFAYTCLGIIQRLRTPVPKPEKFPLAPVSLSESEIDDEWLLTLMHGNAQRFPSSVGQRLQAKGLVFIDRSQIPAGIGLTLLGTYRISTLTAKHPIKPSKVLLT